MESVKSHKTHNSLDLLGLIGSEGTVQEGLQAEKNSVNLKRGGGKYGSEQTPKKNTNCACQWVGA